MASLQHDEPKWEKPSELRPVYEPKNKKKRSRITEWIMYSVAVVISVSRVYVRIHHASDVVAGVALGAALGVAGSRVFTILVH